METLQSLSIICVLTSPPPLHAQIWCIRPPYLTTPDRVHLKTLGSVLDFVGGTLSYQILGSMFPRHRGCTEQMKQSLPMMFKCPQKGHRVMPMAKWKPWWNITQQPGCTQNGFVDIKSSGSGACEGEPQVKVLNRVRVETDGATRTSVVEALLWFQFERAALATCREAYSAFMQQISRYMCTCLHHPSC